VFLQTTDLLVVFQVSQSLLRFKPLSSRLNLDFEVIDLLSSQAGIFGPIAVV